jgi:hypothetical protein
VVLAGLAGFATMAAGEFVANPEYMDAAIRKMGEPGRQKNVELVIATKVINGNSGPPRVLDQYVW